MQKLLLAGLSIFLAVTASLASEKPRARLPYQTPPTLSPGSIETDLLRSQREELAAAEAISAREQNLTTDQKNSIISKILQTKNQELIQELNRLAEDQRKRGIQGITQKQAEQVLASIHQHPVVGPKSSRKYDTWDQMIGYCFGRAAYIHWDLLRRGVTPEKIGKIFAVGGLRQKISNGFHWDYHMATIVRAVDDWWVIDPLIGKIMKVDPWMTDVNQMAANSPSRLRFYFTDAIKLHPIPGAYSLERLLIPEYRGYFQDLFDWFRDHPSRQTDLFFPK